jgi:hypothetical protein
MSTMTGSTIGIATFTKWTSSGPPDIIKSCATTAIPISTANIPPNMRFDTMGPLRERPPRERPPRPPDNIAHEAARDRSCAASPSSPETSRS